MADGLLTVSDLSVHYASRKFFATKPGPAISEISFNLDAGCILGIVGESGSGKTTLMRAVLRLIPVSSGHITFKGTNWLALKGKALASARRKIGVVSQNPFLSLSPRMSIAQILDEATSALDVSVQAQVLNLLMEIRSRTNVAMLFVSHDLAVVQHISDELIVMQGGGIVESGNTSEVTARPVHAYTKNLLSAKKIGGVR